MGQYGNGDIEDNSRWPEDGPKYVLNYQRLETDEELAVRQKRADQRAFRALNPTQKDLARRLKEQKKKIEEEKKERALLVKLKDKYEKEAT